MKSRTEPWYKTFFSFCFVDVIWLMSFVSQTTWSSLITSITLSGIRCWRTYFFCCCCNSYFWLESDSLSFIYWWLGIVYRNSLSLSIFFNGLTCVLQSISSRSAKAPTNTRIFSSRTINFHVSERGVTLLTVSPFWKSGKKITKYQMANHPESFYFFNIF